MQIANFLGVFVASLEFCVRPHASLLRGQIALRTIAPHGPENATDVENATNLELAANKTQSPLPLLVNQNPLAYANCYATPQSCTVNVQKVAAELGPRIVLLFGCSLDIYALDYFCKAANAPVVGFQRNPGNQIFGMENLAYCKIGEFTLAYSFHPGASGPPYYEACEAVLHKPCSQVRSSVLIQQSVASVMATFGKPPSAIVVDSSLWDAANWWMQDGKPPEPYIAPVSHVWRWCSQDLPNLLQAVQAASPTSTVAFRTAPRIEFIAGYGHSTQNIDSMNHCFRGGSLISQITHNPFPYVDYNLLVETFLKVQGGVPSSYFEDAFHPGVLPSVLYIDLVLRWVKGLPLAR